MERFVIIVNGYKPLTIITKRSILDAAAALDPSLKNIWFSHKVQYLRQKWQFLIVNFDQISHIVLLFPLLT